MAVETVSIEQALEDSMRTGVGVQIAEKDWPTVEAAFARYGATPPSRDVAECAKAILDLARDAERGGS